VEERTSASQALFFPNVVEHLYSLHPTIMIRLISYLCKHFMNKNTKNEVDTFHIYMDALDVDMRQCMTTMAIGPSKQKCNK